MSRLVKQARLHSTDTFLTGLGNIGGVLPGSITGLVMTWTGDGLELSIKGVDAFIPSANIKILEFYPEPHDPSPIKTVKKT